VRNATDKEEMSHQVKNATNNGKRMLNTASEICHKQRLRNTTNNKEEMPQKRRKELYFQSYALNNNMSYVK